LPVNIADMTAEGLDALHPDLDLTEARQETFYSDYRTTAGILILPPRTGQPNA